MWAQGQGGSQLVLKERLDGTVFLGSLKWLEVFAGAHVKTLEGQRESAPEGCVLPGSFCSFLFLSASFLVFF